MQEEGLAEVQIHGEDPKKLDLLRSTLEDLSNNCNSYSNISKSSATGGASYGKTKLDKERTKLTQREVQSISVMSRNLKAIVTKSSFNERLKTAQIYLQRLKFLVEDVSFSGMVKSKRCLMMNFMIKASRFHAGCFHLADKCR